MADNKISFLLDLDVKEFTDKSVKAEGLVKNIGDGSNLAGLLSAFDRMLPLLASGTVLFEGFKKSLDLVFEAEELQRVNKQFEILSKTAGVGPEKLKAGLEEAAKGLADTGSLLKIANEALLKVGSSSERLPELMSIATKATEVYGGTAKDNFKLLTDALSEGNVGLLKRYGLTIDIQKAQRDYAAAQGVTIDQLSELGKKQALFNAAIDVGNIAYKDIEVNTDTAINTMEQLKTVLSDLAETFTLAFDKTIGPRVRTFLTTVKDLATDAKLYIKGQFDEGVEGAAARLETSNRQLKAMRSELIKLEELKGTWKDFAPAETQDKIANLTRQIKTQVLDVKHLEAAYKAFQKTEQEAADQRTANIEKNSEESKIDQEKKAKQEADFNAAIAKAQQELFQQQTTNITNLEELKELSNQRLVILETQHASKLKSISANIHLTETQQTKLAEIENVLHHQKIQNLEAQTATFRKKLLDQYVANSKTAFGGISNAFVANSQKMKIDQADFGKRGEETWNSLSANATAAFTNMGAEMAKGKDIGTATAEALKGVFLGMLGDRAVAEGSILLLSSIWPPNPVGIAAGTGLLALGGALKSLAGSSGAPTTAAEGPSPQAVASGAAPRLEPVSSSAVKTQKMTAESITEQETAVPEMQQQQRSQRTVSVHIAGNYLETDQTKRMLMDLMRQESDATGFNYNQIGA